MLGGGHPAASHHFAAPNLKNRSLLVALKCESSECAMRSTMFDGGDQRDEPARAGLTVDEFREWSELNGTPLCGHELPHGGVCRQVAGPTQLSPRAWLHLHRAGRCRSHRP